MARPSKLTPEREAAICDALGKGASWREAAAAAGVAESTVYLWRDRGRKARSGKFSEFSERADRARAEGELTAVEAVFRSFTEPTIERRTETMPDGTIKRIEVERPPDAMMALRFLERRCPDEWSPRHILEHGGALTAGPPPPVEITIKGVQEIADDEGDPGPGGALPPEPEGGNHAGQ